ncbi:NAD(P)H-hydrate dehydratase [Georgenia satyanarayanai]|uniref:NAD(P)H-hydrate dehydratase n=1 Tax=Georgenia satyanarayanai TaxID=860221 RepID=UPI001263F755|nr:NAD(P)H-hydrate dehydratase [Georgenia satyanarayanai]
MTADLTPAALRAWPLPEPGHGKYARGAVVVVGGSPGSPGAVLLSGLAALRVGAGKLSVAVAASVAPALAVAIPEAGVTALAEDDGGTLTGGGLDPLERKLARASAVLVGPGLSDPDSTVTLLTGVLERVGEDVPLVLDAFAVGVLPRLEDQAPALRGRLVLTPNADEIAHLLDVDDVAEDDLPDAVRTVAERYGAAVSCADVIAADGRLWRKVAGNRGLGTSGSGDVLAGAVAGLVARGAGPGQAAVWGTHLHSAAGDRLAGTVGRIGYLARELLDVLPAVLDELGGT